jgi:hypothetical protein
VSIRRLALIALSALFLLGLGTYLAGERTEVVRLRTFDAGGAYETKMWVVDLAGHTYVRIGRRGRGWGERLKANPEVELIRASGTTPCTARIVGDEATRRRVDEAFAAKYGWVDWWYGVVLRSNAETVELDPRAPSAPS